jgi:hypothetical protein
MTFPVIGDKVQFKGPAGLTRGQVVKIENESNFTGTANPWFVHIELKPGSTIRLNTDVLKTVKMKVVT